MLLWRDDKSRLCEGHLIDPVIRIKTRDSPANVPSAPVAQVPTHTWSTGAFWQMPSALVQGATAVVIGGNPMHLAEALPPPEPLLSAVHVLLTVHELPEQVAVAFPVKSVRQSAVSSNTGTIIDPLLQFLIGRCAKLL